VHLLPGLPIFPHASTHAAVTRCCVPRAAHCIPQHGRVDSVTHRPGTASCTQHAPTARPSSRPSFCGFALDPALRMCVPATLTARHHTPRQPGLPPFHRTAACVPTGRAVASRLPRCVTRTPISPCIAPSTSSLTLPLMTARENCLQLVAACSELSRRVPRSPSVCYAATATTIHVTCQCHALAWFRMVFRSKICSEVCAHL